MEWRSIALASRYFALVVLVFALFCSGPSFAERRIVVGDFEGPRSSALRVEVVRALRDDHKLIPRKKAADEVRDAGGDAEGYQKAAAELDVDGFIEGEVKKKGPKFTLTVKIRDGLTGDFISRELKISFRKRLGKKEKRTLRRQLQGAVRELPDRSELADDSEPDDGEDDSDEAEEVSAGDAAEVSEPALEEEEKEEAASPPAAELSADVLADRRIRGRWLELDAGLSFSARTLSFDTAEEIANEPQGYDGAFVPGLLLRGEFYPGALQVERRGILRDIGLSAELDKVLQIKSTLENMPSSVLSTSQTRWGIGVVVRKNFGDSPTSPTVKASIRYNRLRFAIDKSMVPAGTVVELPNASYKFFDPGLELRYPLSPKLAAHLGGRFFIVRGTGEMQDPDAYGGASLSGFELAASAEYFLNPEWLLRGGIEWSQFSYTFRGDGALTDRDGDGEQDVASAGDRFLKALLTVSYLF